jgi:hypothetical protein
MADIQNQEDNILELVSSKKSEMNGGRVVGGGGAGIDSYTLRPGTTEPGGFIDK